MVLFQSNDNNMENFKIDLFIGEYEKDFPEYSHLSESACISIMEKLSKSFSVDFSSNIAKKLDEKQFFEKSIDAKEEFRLIDFLQKINVIPLSKIYINWYKFNDIDSIDLVDMDKYFYDIWFPSSDDIDLFDENFNWIVSIRHDGIVSYIVNI